ncbi:MAG: hypothetical protein NCW75_04855 [Phycisphaera sp.]|nr:MAG: hypothetical protein NCW75_04855 [Phycisphaera sp.]
MTQLNVTQSQTLPPTTDDQGLWSAIRNRSEAISFDRYAAFLQAVFCDEQEPTTTCSSIARGDDGLLNQKDELKNIGHGTKAYQTLKAATEVFLLLNTGMYIHEGGATSTYARSEDTTPGGTVYVPAAPCAENPCADAANLGASGPLHNEDSEATRMANHESLDLKAVQELLEKYLTDTHAILPYLDRIVNALNLSIDDGGNALCAPLLARRVHCPLMIELIWNYWHEAGGQIQTMKAITRRFQNRRACDANDPLADLDIDPLRPLGNILWGYVQDESNQLSVLRRVYEYDHHYGMSLRGKAIPRMCTADSRSKFIAGFHNLLRMALAYYKAAEDTQVIPDTFPMLNSLKEVHLLLAEGAGNQFGDLPHQSRIEMLVEQWILGREEMREFLRGRVMVPYPAAFMGRVDTMRKLQGWGDTSFRYFYELATFGERLLLSIRFGDWSATSSAASAANWANYWREEIQAYVHSYRVVTGVDLSDTKADPATLRRIVTPPQELLSSTRS